MRIRALTHRDDGLERSVQLVDVGEDVLETLRRRRLALCAVRHGQKTHQGDFADESLALLLKVRLLARRLGGRRRRVVLRAGSHGWEKRTDATDSALKSLKSAD